MKPTGDTGPAGIFYAVSFQVSGGGSVILSDPTEGTGQQPTGTLAFTETTQANVQTFLVSDVDYVAEGGQTGTVSYLPLVSEAIDLNRTLALSPSQTNAQVTYGSLSLSNAAGTWNGIYGAYNVSLLPVTILAGMRTFDMARGIEIDPPKTDLVPCFGGVAQDWTLGDDTLTIPLNDATLYLSKPIVSQVAYGGTGRLDGTSSLVGRYPPIARGGTAASPIRNVLPLQVDAVNYVYAYSNAPGTVVNCYVSGYSGAFPRATSVGTNGDVPDVYAATIPQGQFVTCNAKGIIRFGSAPVGQVTLDVTGAFPDGTAVSAAFDVVAQLLKQELLVPAAMIDSSYNSTAATSFTDANPGIGWYWSDGNQLTGQSMLDTLLAGLGLRLMTSRAGLLRVLPLRQLTLVRPAVGALTEDQISAVDIVALPSDVASPTWRWQVGYGHVFQVQTATDLASSQATSDYKTFVSVSDRFSVWSNSALALASNSPGAPASLITAITSAADATKIAAAHGALYGTRRRSFLLTVPRKIALAYDIGDGIAVSWADAGLSGAKAIFVGEQFRSDEATTRIQVLL